MIAKLSNKDGRSASTKKRIAIVTSMPVYYYLPLYKKVANHPQIALTIVFTTSLGWDGPKSPQEYHGEEQVPADYRWVFLDTKGSISAYDGLLKSLNLRIIPFLWRNRFDAIWLHGYNVGTNILSFVIAAWVQKIPVLLRDDQHHTVSSSRLKAMMKKSALPFVFGRCICLSVGSNNEAWLRYFGAHPDRIFRVNHAVDNEKFRKEVSAARPMRRDPAARNTLSIVSVGRLVWQKDFGTLIKAFRILSKSFDVELTIVGDGPLRSELAVAAGELLGTSILLPGHIDQADISEIYAGADVFVLPSVSETWGLVVNEAMNFSLPLVISDAVGCAADLLNHGQNGFLFRSGDANDLASRLALLLASAERRESFGASSLATISNWSFETAFAGVEQALAAVGLVEREADAL